jgi:acetyltransferase-like isoleucine patch superfamily enzyme
MDFFRWCLYTIFEKLLHWSIHPKIRGRLLRYCGAKVGSSVRVHEVTFWNLIGGLKNLKLDDYVYVGANCFFDLTAPIEIGARTAISPACIFITHSDPGSYCGNILSKAFPRKIGRIRIGSDCWVGAGVTILCGVSIGNGAVVGAGAMVMSDVPHNVLVIGNPARISKTISSDTPEPR